MRQRSGSANTFSRAGAGTTSKSMFTHIEYGRYGGTGQRLPPAATCRPEGAVDTQPRLGHGSIYLPTMRSVDHDATGGHAHDGEARDDG